MKLTVVLPAYNEIKTIEEIVKRVRAVAIDKEIIIVDNCSTDGTREVVQKMDYPDVRIVLQERNMRKGNSVKKGIAAAKGDFIIIQDADLEYDPQDYIPLLAEAEKADTFAVLGSRMLGLKVRGEKLKGSVFNIGRAAINTWFQLLYGSRLSDVASCYKMSRRETLQNLKLKCDSFDLDYELSAKFVKGAKRNRQKVVEVPIQYDPRTIKQGKKIGWRDGIAALWVIFKFRFVD